jgi:hypothetical protein
VLRKQESDKQMADTDTKPSETATPAEVKNDATPPSVPADQVNATDNSELEKLKKEKEQAEMRANQLANQLKAKEDAEAETKRKQLEDQQEWKQIAEQNQAKLDAIQQESDEKAKAETLRLAEETIFAEFSQEAIEVAKEAGLALPEDSDSARQTFKEKLQKISDKVVSSNKVTPNNPGTTPETSDRAELVERMRNGDKEATGKVVSELKSLDFMRQQAGYTNEQ